MIVPPVIQPDVAFNLLDDELPLALFPVRLEARWLPDRDPTEIVVRVFPDAIHVDSHDPGFTQTELALAQQYWDSVSRADGDPAAVAAARTWLAGELGPYRAVYVAWASRPAEKEPAKPGRARLRAVPEAGAPVPGRARLLPLRWAAFVEAGETVAGPFWSASPVERDLAATPALVELPPGADARGFLDAQGLGWTHDLQAAENAGMIVRIPIAQLPSRPSEGYQLLVLGVAAGKEHGEAVSALLAAHRYTRGLELIAPGTATNVTDDSPDAAGRFDVQALFEAEFAPPARGRGKSAAAVARALGLGGDTALHRAAGADDAEAELARAANQALWPATWDKWRTDPMSMVSDGSPLLARDDAGTLRGWFTDHVRAEGPLPTLRVGRQPYGILPISTFGVRTGGTVLDHLENTLLDVFANWEDWDSVPLLDPDAADVAPDEHPEEPASDVGAIYGATPHVHELRLRPVDDTHRELVDLYALRLDLVGLLCALVPKDDGTYVDADELESHPWYEAFLRHEEEARGASGVQGQLDALSALLVDLDEEISGNEQQEEAALAIRRFISRFEPTPDDQELPTADVFGMVARHSGRVADAQPYLGQLGVRDELGTDAAPRLYAAAYGDDGTEIPVGVLVAAGSGEDAAGELAGWLGELRDGVAAFAAGAERAQFEFDVPAPLLQQLLRSAAATVGEGVEARALLAGLERLKQLVDEAGAGAIPVLERLMRGTLGLAIYRVDAWMTALATERLDAERAKRPTGLQVGAYGWLVSCAPREGRASQGHIHAPSLDHATTAAVLRSGWSAFGTAARGSPLAVDLSSPRIRAAKSLVEGVRSGHELGRLLGGRFERLLHDRGLDRHIDEIREAVLKGSGRARRPPTRIVDGLLVARAYTDGVERTQTEQDVRAALDPIVTADAGVKRAVDDVVGELDAVADVLFSQSVHALLRGDAGVAAPTLAATGSADSGLPAVDFPESLRGGRVVTLRVVGMLGPDRPGAWPGAAASVLAAAEPRLEAWAGELLGPPAKVVADVDVGGARKRVNLGVLGLGALDAVFGIERLAERLGGGIVPGRPADLADDELAFDEFVTLARAVRLLLGRIRPLLDADLATDPEVADSRDAGELAARLALALALVPPDDERHARVEAHRREHPGETADLLIERLRIVTVEPVPILPLIAAGVPETVAASFGARRAAVARSQGRTAAWLVQAATVRPDLHGFLDAVQLAELATLRQLLSCAIAQSPDAGGSWAGDREPAGSGAVTAWCTVTGAPPAGPVAGFVVDAWTETIPDVTATSGIAVHFDRPSAVAPNAVLLAVTRGGESFDLDHVHRCVRNTLRMAQFRALSPDAAHAFLGQFLPAAFLPGETAVPAAEGEAQ